MTLHSFAEGVAIGSSFCSSSKPHLGFLTSLSLAIHNIPEGIAISLVLIPSGVSPSAAALWSIISSIPQPIMYVLFFF